ncbi:MAG TPA: FGGY-family carbohydrate kinase [Firmicutes bacterium]|nr:FGGY-family carbohydrate kinase [Bacillota bacterium]
MIDSGCTTLGIEFGSTRIKAVLSGEDHTPLASGSHTWENKLENGIWTYSLEEIWTGLQSCYQDLAENVWRQYKVKLTCTGAIGISGMMHGYLVFDKNDQLLVPFRTWRNTITGQAAELLRKEFNFNIPQRWSIAHLYQAILNGEEHVKDIAFMTTLAGYVHWQLTGEKVLGVGDASGMFPIDSSLNDYNPRMIRQFEQLIAGYNYSWKLENILPEVLVAGDHAGYLSVKGAKLLDPTGTLQPGIPLCPPEGDAGTGMVATNSVAPRTGNVSAGTSIFAMIVLEKELSKVHPEIDLVTTPTGKPVAMVHCNNCSSDLDDWVAIFAELLENMGRKPAKDELYSMLYNKALSADPDGGNLLAYNYVSGEHITGFTEGRPLFVRTQNSNFTLGNFMRTLLFSAMGTLRIGMDILTRDEQVGLDKLLGHGGLFKTKGVAQRLMAGALNVPVAVMESAGEGGAWGIALLAAYMKNKTKDETLEDYLDQRVFANEKVSIIAPQAEEIEGFNLFFQRYKDGLNIEKAAVEHFT